jgi:hypothetical protein
MKSFYDGLHYYFSDGSPGAGLKLSEITWDMFENHYKDMSKVFGYTMKPEESLINNYGYQFLLTEKNIDKALEFFKKNIENYPQIRQCV